MTRFVCRQCGEDHDLEEWEPSYGLPDDVFALSEEEQAKRAAAHDRNFCELKGEAGAPSRWFVRTLLPFPVDGRSEPCRWGVWVELRAAAFAEIRTLWDSPEQLQAGPWQATLANDAVMYPSTRGLRGSVRFTHLDRIPEFALHAEQAHPFEAEFQTGVAEERVNDWYHYFQSDDSAEQVSNDADPNEPSLLLECDTHGTAPSAVVCTHLVDARDRAVGFVENSSDPEDLQAWCGDCEQFFEREGELTEAFKRFCDIRLVCVFCYATIKERQETLSR